MLIVAIDTNVVVSGLLWFGAPHTLFQIAGQRQIQIVTSEALLDELRDVLQRKKFAKLNTTPEALVEKFLKIATVVTPVSLTVRVSRDEDDDLVVACALGGHAVIIVTGDDDLLSLGTYQGIKIVAPAALLEKLSTDS